MSIQAESNLEDRYWIQKGGINFEFHPYTGKIITTTDGYLLKAIHFIGGCNLEVDWDTFDGRTFLIKYPPSATYRDYLITLNTFVSKLDSKVKQDKHNLLANNIDHNTGKSLNIHTIRVGINNLKKEIKDKKKTRVDIVKFFNRFNIEDDVERIARGGGILKVDTKSSATLFTEGKDALERLFKKGKLIKLTRAEYDAKMEEYGNK